MTALHDDPPPHLVETARDWVMDCTWVEDPEEIAAMSDQAILDNVERHYVGGLDQLARDAAPVLIDLDALVAETRDAVDALDDDDVVPAAGWADGGDHDDIGATR